MCAFGFVNLTKFLGGCVSVELATYGWKVAKPTIFIVECAKWWWWWWWCADLYDETVGVSVQENIRVRRMTQTICLSFCVCLQWLLKNANCSYEPLNQDSSFVKQYWKMCRLLVNRLMLRWVWTTLRSGDCMFAIWERQSTGFNV